jgi:GNAT superfamily N-acetyltransferase
MIRKAYPGDYAAWAQMATDYVPQLANVVPRAWTRFFMADARDFCVLAIEDDQPVAFMQYCFHDFPFATKPICYMDALYTRPEYRGKGIASALIGYLEGLGQINGWGRIYWVTEENNPARALYNKIAPSGFVRYHKDLV